MAKRISDLDRVTDIFRNSTPEVAGLLLDAAKREVAAKTPKAVTKIVKRPRKPAPTEPEVHTSA